ncbi:hypothetical protein Tco_0998562 [Tanacetum coccineum]
MDISFKAIAIARKILKEAGMLERLLSRFMQEPKEQHMKAIKKVLRFVKGTKIYGITYRHYGAPREHAAFMPIVIAVVSPFPPSDKIGLICVQRESREVVDI